MPRNDAGMAATAPTNTARPFFILLTALGSCLAVLIQLLPFGTVETIPLAPAFALIALFYWAVHTPEICPPWIPFVCGLFQDILSGGPLGFWALIYVIVFQAVLQNRLFFRANAGDFLPWAGFAMVAVLTSALAWAAGSVYFGQLMSPIPVLGQMGITALCYPVLAHVMLRIGRMFGVSEARA